MGELRGGDISLGYPLWMLGFAGLSAWLGRIEIVAIASPAALLLRTACAGLVALGWANGLTWLRILATCALVLLPAASLTIAGLALLVFALDGVDGALARALGTSSDFGANLDMECDAFFVLMLGLLLWSSGQAGLWALVPGLWRYFYSVVVHTAVNLREMPRSNWARYTYSTSCLCLIAALWRETPCAGLLVAIAAMLISASFVRSLYYSFSRG